MPITSLRRRDRLCAAGHVAEFLDGLPHPDPGGLANAILAVHHPRDRRGGHAGQARDIVESYHFVSISGIAVSSADGWRDDLKTSLWTGHGMSHS
jgi:hypothetical protein